MLFSDCTKEVIIPCSSLTMNENQAKLIDDRVARHPKFNVHQMNEKNLTLVDRKNIITRKKNEKNKKESEGFIAKWFGSDSGRFEREEEGKNKEIWF